MLIRNPISAAIQRQFRAPEGGEGGGAGAGEGGTTPPTITPEVQALIDAAVTREVTGLKTKNGELLGKLTQKSNELKRYEGIDPEAVRGILKRFTDDEEAALIAAGKIDEVLNKRTERLREDMTRQLTEAQEASKKSQTRSQKFESRVLQNAMRAAATAAGVHAHAVEDALLLGGTIFSLDDDGEAIARDADGHAILGKDGKTPLTPQEWFEGMKVKRPHWFPATASGGGSGGGGGGGGGADKNAREMTPKEKSEYIAKHGMDAWSKKTHADYSKPAA